MVLYSDLILQVAKDHNFFLRSIEIRLSAYVESSLGVGYIFSCSSGNRCCASEPEIDANLRYCHCFLCSWEGKGNKVINLYQWSQKSDKHKTVSEFFLLIGKLDTMRIQISNNTKWFFAIYQMRPFKTSELAKWKRREKCLQVSFLLLFKKSFPDLLAKGKGQYRDSWFCCSQQHLKEESSLAKNLSLLYLYSSMWGSVFYLTFHCSCCNWSLRILQAGIKIIFSLNLQVARALSKIHHSSVSPILKYNNSPAHFEQRKAL